MTKLSDDTPLSDDLLGTLEAAGELGEALCVGEDVSEERQKRPTRQDRHVRLAEYLDERRLARELRDIDGWVEE
ncbi:MAG: hypothetical protein A3J38_02950 [Gammaproteobacteria bacterium RIFCSPHIGHO2_12_FULL_45_9]|nr:MAG: hypothetical protein A3J38_02950 [Gammaproteobacteria bacterium RIFCSPHIGHO2_12_FULL_45_9]